MECIISGENMLHVFEYTLKIPLRFHEPVAPCSPRGGGRIDNISNFQCIRLSIYISIHNDSFFTTICLGV